MTITKTRRHLFVVELRSSEGTTEEQHEAHGQAHGTKWVGQFEQLCSNLDQAPQKNRGMRPVLQYLEDHPS